MADLDTALDEALKRHDPTFYPPDTSAFMRRQRAELVDIEPLGPDDDEADEEDFTHDDHADGESRSSGTSPSVVND